MTQFLNRLQSLFLFALAAVALASCTTTSGRVARNSPPSPYGDYLSARFASSESDVQKAALYYASALKKDPENTELEQRAMLSAVFAGHIDKAAKYAKPVLDHNPDDRLAVLILASQAMSKGKYNEAEIVIANAKLGPLNKMAGGLIQSWALEGQGKTEAAFSILDEVEATPGLGQIAKFHRALILSHANRLEQADEAFASSLKTGLLSQRTAYAWALKQWDEDNVEGTLSTLNERLAKYPTEIEAVFVNERIQAKKPLSQVFTTPRQGAAEALYGLAQVFVGRSLHDLAAIYLEMGLHMDPKNGAAQDLLGRLYELQRRGEDALTMFSSIDQDSPWYIEAKMDQANALFRLDRREDALSGLEVLATEHPTRQVKRALAAALQIDQQYEAARFLFNEIIEEDPAQADWRLYYSRAVCLERTDRWREAVPDFRKALEMEPQQADVLNYLGYTFVNAGENLDEGFALIRQAIALSPNAGYIIDSLGWGYYKLGKFDEAVSELEHAVALEPGEPTINDHLGDAYWQVGRHLEAGFQWQRVLSLKPDQEIDLAEINQKIKNGLPLAPSPKLAGGL